MILQTMNVGVAVAYGVGTKSKRRGFLNEEKK